MSLLPDVLSDNEAACTSFAVSLDDWSSCVSLSFERLHSSEHGLVSLGFEDGIDVGIDDGVGLDVVCADVGFDVERLHL